MVATSKRRRPLIDYVHAAIRERPSDRRLSFCVVFFAGGTSARTSRRDVRVVVPNEKSARGSHRSRVVSDRQRPRPDVPGSAIEAIPEQALRFGELFAVRVRRFDPHGGESGSIGERRG